MMKLMIMATLLLTACDTGAQDLLKESLIKGRTGQTAVYRMLIPSGWVATSFEETGADTTLPLMEYRVQSPQGTIRITVHNFPVETIDQRIPPASQIARWKQQIKHADHDEENISWSGYQGIYLEAIDAGVMGWALQLASDHTYALFHEPEKRADVTIKATGPSSALFDKKEEIHRSVYSFELLDDIPQD